MFHWLLGNKMDLARIFQQFGQMLEDGRHTFDAASNSLVGGTDPSVVEADLFATDKRINLVEQKIRRELVVHVSVADRIDFPTCLALMSLVKDAERIGDYAKNILEVARACPDFHKDPRAKELAELKDRVSRLLAKMRSLYDSQNADQARAFVEEADEILTHCDDAVNKLLANGADTRYPVAAALMYRYVKRVMAHAMNIVSSIIMPVDKLDYYDEDKASRGPSPEEL